MGSNPGTLRPISEILRSYATRRKLRCALCDTPLEPAALVLIELRRSEMLVSRMEVCEPCFEDRERVLRRTCEGTGLTIAATPMRQGEA